MSVFYFVWLTILANDPGVLLSTIETLHAGLHDSSFVFEGEIELSSTKKPIPSPEDTIPFNGKGKYHSDGHVWVEFLDSESGLDRQKFISVSLGSDCRLKLASKDIKSIPTQKTMNWSWQLIDGEITWLPMFAVVKFRLMPEAVRRSLHYEGQQNIEGRNCEVLSYTSPTRRNRFWLDMSRGANFVRSEEWRKEKLLFVYHSIQLQELPDTKGNLHWFVIGGIRDAFPAAHFEEIKTERARTHVRILRETVKLNTGMPASEAIVAFDNRHFIMTPELSKQSRERYERTKDRQPPAPNLRFKDIHRVHQEAKDQEAALKSQIRPREPVNYWSILAGACGVLGLGGLLWAWRVARRSAA